MKMMRASVFLALAGLLLPALVSAGNGPTGACLGQSPTQSSSLFPIGKGIGAVCVDGISEGDCLKGAGGEWFEGETCGELEVPWIWEGSCQADVPPFGDACYVLWDDGDAQLSCEQQDGTWYPDDLTCGAAPVPAMPAAGMAMMMLVILGGALVLLTIRGSVASG